MNDKHFDIGGGLSELQGQTYRRLHLRLFGNPAVGLDEQPLAASLGGKAQALLYYLAVTGRAHSRPALAGLLWGDFLEGFYIRNAPDFETWVLIERARFRDLALQALTTLTTLHTRQGDLAQAIEATRRLLWHSLLIRACGPGYPDAGDATEALCLLEESRQFYHQSGDRWSLARVLNHMGAIAASQANLLEARRHFLDALRAAQRANGPPRALDALVGLAALLAQAHSEPEGLASAEVVRQHPSATQEAQDRAGQLAAELAARLTAEQVERARTRSGRSCRSGWMPGDQQASSSNFASPVRRA